MEKYKVLRNLGRNLPPFKEGETVELKAEEAEGLLAKGLICAVPKEAVKAVPNETKPTKTPAKSPTKASGDNSKDKD